MAFPTVVNVSQNSSTGNTSSHVIDTTPLTASTLVGDILLVVFSASKQTVAAFATESVANDWICVGMTYDSVASTSVRAASAIYYKVAKTNSTTYPLTITTNDSCYSSHIVYLIRGANTVIAKSAIGRSSFPDSPSLDIGETTVPDVLWFIAESTYFNNKNGGPIIPSGYTNYTVETPNNQQGAATWSYRRTLSATVEDPGVVQYGSPGVHDSWISWTIAVYDMPIDANYPTVTATTVDSLSSPGTTHIINLPPHNAGDLLMVIFSITGSQTLYTLTSTSKNWNKMIAFDAMDLCTSAVFWKVSNGVERLEIISSNSARSSHICYKIINADSVTVNTNFGTAIAVTTPSLTYNEQTPLNAKIFSIASPHGNAYAFATPPSNYNKMIIATPSLNTTTATVSSYRNYNTTSTDTPGVYSSSSPAPSSWIGWTIAVYKKPEIYPKVIATSSGNISPLNDPDINYPSRDYKYATILPSNVAGSVLVVIFNIAGIDALDTVVDTSLSGNGWSKLFDVSSLLENQVAFYKTAEGTNSLTVRRDNGTSMSSFIAYAIQDADISTIAGATFVQNSSSFLLDPPNITASGIDKYLFISTAGSRDSFNSAMFPYNHTNYTIVNEGITSTMMSAISAYYIGSLNPSYFLSRQLVDSSVSSTILIKYKTPAVLISLPQTGNLSIKSAATVNRSIAQAVEGNNTGSKSLRQLSQKASKLYGMTSDGGSGGSDGVLFEFDLTTNAYNVLVNFDSNPLGTSPNGSLLYYNGALYGMTSNEGLGSGTQYGTLFKYDIFNNTIEKKYQFRGESQNEGSHPQGSLTLFNDKFYGMTFDGRTADYGCIFEYDPNTNVLTYKVNFFGSSANAGQHPYGSLTLYNNKFYGMTADGGVGFDGTLFEYDPVSNIFTKKKDLDVNANDPKNPRGDLRVFNNKLYGMCSQGGVNGNGTIFEYDPNTDVLTVKHSFNNTTTGGSPYGSLTLYNNKFYGMTQNGGPSSTDGTIFEYDPISNIFTHKLNIEDINLSRPLEDFVLANEKLYAMTFEGGLSNYGGIFEYNPNTNSATVLRQFGAPGNNSLGVRPSGSLTPFNGAFLKEKGTNLNSLPEEVIGGGDFENGIAPFIFSGINTYNGTGLSISNSTDIAYVGTRSGKILKSFGSLSMGSVNFDYASMVAYARLDNPVVGKRYKASIYVYTPNANPIANDDHDIIFTITDKRYRGSGTPYSNFSTPASQPNTFETVISNTTLSISSNKSAWKKMECVFQVNALFTYLGIGYDENKVPIFLMIKGPSNSTTINGNGIMYIDQIDIREIEATSLLDAPYGMKEFYGYGNIVNTNVNLSIDFPTYFSSTSGPYRGSSQMVTLNATNVGLFGDSSFGVRISKALQIFSASSGQSAKASIYNNTTSVLSTVTSSNGFGTISVTSDEDLTIFGNTLMKFNMSVEELGNNASVNAFARITVSSVWTNGAINPTIVASSVVTYGTMTSTI